jgi:hypothetical protein
MPDADPCQLAPGSLKRAAGILLFLLWFATGATLLPLYPFLALSLGDGGLGLGPFPFFLAGAGYAFGAIVATPFVRIVETRTDRPAIVLAALCLALAVLTASFSVVIASMADEARRELLQGSPSLLGPDQLHAAVKVGGFLAVITLLNTSAIAIGSSIIVAGLKEAFCRSRIWGTLGFMAACLAVGLCVPLISPYLMASAAYLILAVYCLNAPFGGGSPSTTRGGRADRRRSADFGSALIRIWPELLVVVMGAGILPRLYDLHASRFLKEIGLGAPIAILSIGLVAEVSILWSLPALLDRGGHRFACLLCPLGWGLVFVGFMVSGRFGSPLPAVVGLPAMGFNCALLTVCSVIADRRVKASARATAQGLIVSAQAVGILCGSLVSWLLAASCDDAGRMGWGTFWALAAAAAAGATLVAVLLPNGPEPPVPAPDGLPIAKMSNIIELG